MYYVNDEIVEKMPRQFGVYNNRWCCIFWFSGWDSISLGLHLCLSAPNIEIHIPFGFIRIGWHAAPVGAIIEIPEGYTIKTE